MLIERDFSKLYNSMLNDFDSFFNLRPLNLKQELDYVTDEDGVKLAYEMPGYQKEDIDISVEDGYVVIKAKRDHEILGESSFFKRIRLGPKLNMEEIDVTLRDGVLLLTVPKMEKEVKRIEIKTSED